MAQIPQTNVSISAINTEVSSVSSTNLRVLSDGAKAGSDPKDGQPYGMGEFRGYIHGPSTQAVTYTSVGPQGKISAYSTSSMSPTSMPFGSYALQGFASNGSAYFRIFWSGGLNTGWTSLSIGGVTLVRTNATTSGSTHFFAGTLSNVGSGTATFTYP